MSLVGISAVALGQIQRQAFYVFFDHLNDALAEQDLLWASSDQEFEIHTGRTIEPITLEPVVPENFHEGHNPGLIEAEIDEYPNCSVMIERWVPAPTNATADHWDERQLNLGIEIMAKSVVSPAEANQRTIRMVEAVHAVLAANRSLGGAVQEVTDAGNGFLTSIDRRAEQTSYGSAWYWQGGRVNYTIKLESGRSGPDGPYLPSDFGIDQS
jgi:hypothetical protein